MPKYLLYDDQYYAADRYLAEFHSKGEALVYLESQRDIESYRLFEVAAELDVKAELRALEIKKQELYEQAVAKLSDEEIEILRSRFKSS